MIKFKSYEDLAFNAFYSCHVSECELEAEKLYNVCIDHYTELTK